MSGLCTVLVITITSQYFLNCLPSAIFRTTLGSWFPFYISFCKIQFTFTTSQLNSIHDVPFHISSLALPCILGIHLSPSSWHNIQYWTFSVNKETLSSHSLVLGIISRIAKLRNLQDFNPRYSVNWLWDSCYCGPNIFLRKTRVKIAIVTNILHGQFVRV